MARKSRKDAVAEPIVEVAPLQIFPTAIYARLSVENSGKSENVDVITNQIEICKSYIADRPYLNLVDTYIDNGRTGTVFDRPEFNRLMTDIKSGRIKCLVVRDLSRFGRDYIETGTYLERIFPQIGLRFIAIKENYDNLDTDGSNESLIIPLQNMINALYSKDISRKVSTALKAQMEQGTFQKRNLPYGYRWNAERSNMVIDEETAQYVRLMFKWKIEGWSIPMILDELDRLGAPNTELRKRQNGTRTGDGCSCKGWYSSTLYGILTNPHYVGDTVLGRSMKAIYKGIKSHNVKNKDEWIVFPNTHEAIISREDFQKVQDIMNAASETRQTKMQKSEEIRATLINLFDGKIVCADCGKRMYFHRKRIDKDKRGRWYAFYECSTSVSRRYEHCTAHYTRQDKLEADVLAAIQLQVKAALDYDKLLDKLRGSEGEKNIRDKQNALSTSLNLKLSGVSTKRTRLHEDFAEGLL
ncbi:MAG: recombinase family protein, partial [Bacteroidales bacterium]|nr:recombinase family protein [Bacteroidales bacterium]